MTQSTAPLFSEEATRDIQWLPTHESENYLVSDSGDLWIISRNRAVRLSHEYNGYAVAIGWVRGRRKKFRMNRLVARTFIGDSPLQVAHVDGVRTNNTLGNLWYATAQENTNDRMLNGIVLRGEQNPFSKLSEPQVLAIVDLRKAGMAYKAIASIYGINPGTAKRICVGDTWSSVTGILKLGGKE